jgi:hypothetical protein
MRKMCDLLHHSFQSHLSYEECEDIGIYGYPVFRVAADTSLCYLACRSMIRSASLQLASHANNTRHPRDRLRLRCVNERWLLHVRE